MEGEYNPAIPLAKLVPCRININKLGEEKLKILARVIRQDMRVPIEVCHLTSEFEEYPGEDGFYLIVDGHHRCAAAKEAGLITIPAMVFNYSRREARLRMFQTNVLRGQVQRANASDLLNTIEMEDSELANRTGVRKAEIRKLRELQRETGGKPPSEKTEWHTERLVYALDVDPVVKDALNAALARYREQSPDLDTIGDYTLWKEYSIDLAREHPQRFFEMLLHLLNLIRDSIGEGAALKGPETILFQKAMDQAQWLAESEHRGHAFTMIAADFLAGASTPKQEKSYR